ncbi:MAG: hypothetical protein LIP10_03445 [Clostridiales bacterium]|nr:hypothetical protein [Clostridiales bacterium]
MELSSSLLKSFAATTNDTDSNTSSVGTAYGTVYESDGKRYVMLDGATTLTAIVEASDCRAGDRVIVTIENHTATVTSNLSTPSSGYTATETEEIVQAYYGEFQKLDAYFADITYLETYSTITEYLTATYADINSLTALQATVNDLAATTITTEYLSANYVSTEYLTSKYITAEDIAATYVTTGTLTANYASITYLDNYYLKTEDMDAKYADIELLNVETESVKNLFVTVGLLTNATIADAYITGELNGVTISASCLTSGTIDAGTIDVVNLNCANLTVGTINGTQISSGTITLENLASDVTDEINAALTEAGLAYDEATDAYTLASGKNTAYYQSTEPSGGNYSVNDLWFDTANDYAMYYWDGSKWVAATFGMDALSSDVRTTISDVVTTAGAAYDAATDAYTIASGKNTIYYSDTAPGNGYVLDESGDKVLDEDGDPIVDIGSLQVNDVWYDTANGFLMYYWNGTEWVQAALGYGALEETVSSNIKEALTTAGAAYDEASNAYTLAAGKNTIYYASEEPTGGEYSVNDIWYDLSNDMLMYYWDGTEWVEASLGYNALSVDVTSLIENALEDAGLAYDTASDAYVLATGKSSVFYSATEPSEGYLLDTSGNTILDEDGNPIADTGTYQVNDVWYDTSNGFLMYYWDGSQWVEAALGTGALGTDVTSQINTALTTAGAAYDEATNAYTLAAGKNTVYYSDSAPDGSDCEINDIWYDTANGFLMYYWNGSEWVAASLGYGALETDISLNIAEALETAGLAWDEATGAYTVAVGKTTAYYQDDEPSNDRILDESGNVILDESEEPIYGMEDDAYTVNDIWYDTDDGNAMYYWDGSQWVQGQYGTNAISDNAITADKIVAGAIVAGKIAAGAVTADTIAANTITGDKIAANTITADNIAANTITGNLIAANTITASNLVAGTITSNEIAAEAITTEKIAAEAITGSLIAANSITASHIVAGTITADEIASETITGDLIAANAITSSLIAANTITASNIASGTITSEEIASGTITASNIKSGTITGSLIAANTITATNIAAGTITADEIASETITGDLIAAETITGGKLVAGTITATQIAAYTITSDNIRAGSIVGSSLAAETITGENIAALTITGDKLVAESITADKLSIGTGGNLYSNYDTFEQITDSTLYYAATNVSSATVTTDTAWFGSKCLKMVGTGDAYVYLGNEANNYGCIPVTAGQYYRISVYVKCSSEATVRIFVVGHTDINTTNSEHTEFTATAGTGWTRIEGTYLATSTYPYISIRVGVQGTASGGITDTDGDYITDTSGSTILDESGSTDSSATVTAYFDAIMVEEVSSSTQMASSFKAAGSTLINGGNIITRTITATQIAAGTITANEIDVTNLFAQTITATGSITGLNLYGTYIEATYGYVGGWYITPTDIYDKTSETYQAGIGKYGGRTAFWAGTTFDNAGSAPFRVGHDGSLTATSANITGTINATGGSFTGSVYASSFALSGVTLSIGTTTNSVPAFVIQSGYGIYADTYIEAYAFRTVNGGVNILGSEVGASTFSGGSFYASGTGVGFYGDSVSMWTDSEGGNISITSPSSYGKSYQIDAYNGDLRVYCTYNSTNYFPISIKTSGVSVSALSVSGTASFTGRVTFGNGIMNLMGDDCYIGDNNVSGAICLKGNSGDTKIRFYDRSDSDLYADIYMDGDGTYGQTFYIGGDFVSIQAAYNNTITSSANVHVGSAGGLWRYSSSSERYKNIVSELSEEDILPLYDIPTYWFQYKDDYLKEDDERYLQNIPGFIAERWNEVLPIAVDHLEDGSAEMWNSNIVVPLTFEMVKHNHSEIETLKSQIAELQAQLAVLQASA